METNTSESIRAMPALPAFKLSNASIYTSTSKRQHDKNEKKRLQRVPNESDLPVDNSPLVTSLPFKDETLQRSDVRAHFVIETIAHTLFMQEQLPWPWPKVFKWWEEHTAARLNSDNGKRRSPKKFERQLLKTANQLLDLFSTIRGLFVPSSQQRPYDVRRVAIVYGPSPRRALWTIVLEFDSFYIQDPATVPRNNLDVSPGGGEGCTARVLDVCGRRLKRLLLEASVGQPSTGVALGTPRATKLHVLFMATPCRQNQINGLVQHDQLSPQVAPLSGSATSCAATGDVALPPLPALSSKSSPSCLSTGLPHGAPLLAVPLSRSRLPTELSSLPNSLTFEQNTTPLPNSFADGTNPSFLERRKHRQRKSPAWPQRTWALCFTPNSPVTLSSQPLPEPALSLSETSCSATDLTELNFGHMRLNECSQLSSGMANDMCDEEDDEVSSDLSDKCDDENDGISSDESDDDDGSNDDGAKRKKCKDPECHSGVMEPHAPLTFASPPYHGLVNRFEEPPCPHAESPFQWYYLYKNILTGVKL